MRQPTPSDALGAALSFWFQAVSELYQALIALIVAIARPHAEARERVRQAIHLVRELDIGERSALTVVALPHDGRVRAANVPKLKIVLTRPSRLPRMSRPRQPSRSVAR